MTSRAVANICAGVLLATPLLGCSGGADQPPTARSSVEAQTSSGTVVRNLGPEGDSGLTLGNARYRLDSAIGDVWGQSDNHYQINFTLTDGNFRVESEIVDGQPYVVLKPHHATAVFYARVFSPGDSFEHTSYAFVPSGVATLPGVGFFTDAYVGVDSDGDGKVANAEKLSVIDGMVDFSGMEQDIQINLAVTLTNGRSVTGDYSGLLDYTLR